MKIKFLFLFTIAYFAVSIFSCEKKDDLSDDNIGKVTANIDGQLNEFTSTSAFIDVQDRLIITTESEDSLRPYIILELFEQGEGIYILTTPAVAQAQYYPGFGMNELYYSKAGNIHITKHEEDQRRVKGTFDITFEEVSGATVEVRNGVFDVIYD